MTPAGFPHSEIHGSKLESSSPWLIAGFRVLHRLLVPRHPPCALCSLTKLRPRGTQCAANHRHFRPFQLPLGSSKNSEQMSRARGSFRHHEPTRTRAMRPPLGARHALTEMCCFTCFSVDSSRFAALARNGPLSFLPVVLFSYSNVR